MSKDDTDASEKQDNARALGLESLMNYRVQRLASKMTLVTTREVLRGFGINIAEWRVIARLTQEGPQKMTAISRMLGLDAGRASRLLKAVESKGLVRRESDPEDGRASIFHLTRRSEELFEHVWPHASRLADSFHALYTDEERETLYELLDRATNFANERLK